ncbi:MAG TPA: AAA-associated domain-containing protein, partial [Gemmataceae bacterium]|nr:AAA-associated domain-containing protein [Gemmataceae bacterium]
MDEPFSQVDALTAESLRAEVLDIWSAHQRRLSSILMVSHDIKEVAWMADRIVVLAANPGRVRTVIDNRLPRPRDYSSPAFLALVDQLHEVITKSELPDVPEPAPAGPPSFEPLPECSSNEIVGLLEYLDARGGKDDLFRIASDTHRPFGQVINVVKAAEMLGFVDTPRRQVVLAADGLRFVRAGPTERKAIWREQLLKLRLFREVHDALVRQPRHEADRLFVLETIALHLPDEDNERTFQTFVRWARFGDLLAYDEVRQTISLQQPPSAAA